MSEDLATKIAERISRIPASGGGVIDLCPTTLGDKLNPRLIEMIAVEAAKVAQDWYHK